MYERRIEHSLFKTTLELQRLRLLKTLEHPNPANAGIPIPQEPIINNQSSIVNIESPPEPGQNHPTSTIKVCPPKAESSIIAQNKPNVKIGKMTISPATTKPYLNEQQTMNNERYSKQTQSNPIPARRDTIRDIQYDMPRQQARSVSAGVFTKQQQPLSVSLPHRGAGVFSDNSPMDALTKSSYNAP
jgi:hypothetical protein